MELKPCPFCGDDNYLEVHRTDVYCNNCCASGPSSAISVPRDRAKDEGIAIEAWNRREA